MAQAGDRLTPPSAQMNDRAAPNASDAARGPVAVLAGGPDAERSVSMQTAGAIHAALERAGVPSTLIAIDRPGAHELASLLESAGVGAGAGVAFPALHGPFGEGGELQRLLDETGVRYVGSGAHASRLAIDKFATKQLAARVAKETAQPNDGAAVGVSPTWFVDPALGEALPGPLPLAVKPNFEGSTVGLHICHTDGHYKAAMDEARALGRATIAEPAIVGHELTVGLLAPRGRPDDLEALPLIHIAPAGGLYDFAAKYERDDTVYTPDPILPGLDAAPLQRFARALANAAGVRHLARADFIYDEHTRTAWFLEINTMPGFTSHSLLPMAAAHAGVGFDDLCGWLVEAATALAPAGAPKAGASRR